MRNTRPDEAQAGIKIAGRNIHNLRYADDTTLTSSRTPLISILGFLRGLWTKLSSSFLGKKLNEQENHQPAFS